MPNTIGDYLDLSGLNSVEDLVLSCNIGRDLFMYNLKSLDGISFTENFSLAGSFYSQNITPEEFCSKVKSAIEAKMNLSSNIEKEKLGERRR